MMGYTWRDQRERMKRTLRRLQGPHTNADEYRDDLYHFFQDAWHLKDWIRNDPTIAPAIRDAIENEVTSITALRIAADIANGTKHLELTRPREGATITSKSITVFPGTAKPAKYDWTITLSGGTVIARDHLHEVVKAWDTLLGDLSLTP